MGASKWSISKAVRLAIDAIVGFSGFPIRLISIVGALLCAFGFLCAAVLAVQHIVSGSAVGHWNLIVVALLALEGIQLLMLGIAGEYVLRAADQSKGRPQFIVMAEIGFDRTNG